MQMGGVMCGLWYGCYDISKTVVGSFVPQQAINKPLDGISSFSTAVVGSIAGIYCRTLIDPSPPIPKIRVEETKTSAEMVKAEVKGFVRGTINRTWHAETWLGHPWLSLTPNPACVSPKQM